MSKINTILCDASANDETAISMEDWDFQDNYDIIIPVTYKCIDNIN